jgi:hypothetical protein
MSKPEAIKMEDFEEIELQKAELYQECQQTRENRGSHPEPSLVIGHDVFRKRQRFLERRRMVAIVLGAIAVLFLASTITLAVLYGKLLQQGHDPVPAVMATTTADIKATKITARTTDIAISPAAP